MAQNINKYYVTTAFYIFWLNCLKLLFILILHKRHICLEKIIIYIWLYQAQIYKLVSTET